MSGPVAGMPKADRQSVEQFIDAAPEDVFSAWITPDTLEKWWGPDGFTTRVLEINAVEGGRFVFEMTAPDGSSCNMTGRYRTINPPGLLVFEVIDHCNIGLPDHVEPQLLPSRVTVRITPYGTAARVSVTHALLGPGYEWLALTSWTSVLARLEASCGTRG